MRNNFYINNVVTLLIIGMLTLALPSKNGNISVPNVFSDINLDYF